MSASADQAGPGRAGAYARRAVTLSASIAVTLFGLCAITFVIGRLLPLDPVLAVPGDDASQEARQRMTKKLGLHLPLWQQFLYFMNDLIRLDFGRSVTTGAYVATDLKRVVGGTIELSVLAIAMAIAAVRRDRWPKHLVSVITLVGYSAPTFWPGLMGLSVFYASLGWAGWPGRSGSMCSANMISTPAPGFIFLTLCAAVSGRFCGI